MKDKRFLLIGLILGLVLGWVLGFLRIPYLAPNDAFGVGFGAALALVALWWLLFPAQRSSGNRKTRVWVWRVLTVAGIAVGAVLFQWFRHWLVALHERDQKIQKMTELLEFGQKNNPEPLLRNVLEDIGKELKNRPGRTLSDTMITRIAALSFAFPSAPFIEHDTLSTRKNNPGRGQLLQALLLLNIHPGSFAKIKQQTIFDEADLRHADLKGLDLSGIRLSGAQLEQTNLTGANLKSANLEGANLWGALLNKANLRQINLKKADLRWAQLNESDLTQANMNEANLSNAQFRKALFYDASVQWTQAEGAMFNEANMESIDLVSTNATNASFRNVNMANSDLRSIVLAHADIVGVEFNRCLVNKRWLEEVSTWQSLGEKELLSQYTFVSDTVDKFKKPLHRLFKK